MPPSKAAVPDGRLFGCVSANCARKHFVADTIPRPNRTKTQSVYLPASPMAALSVAFYISTSLGMSEQLSSRNSFAAHRATPPPLLSFAATHAPLPARISFLRHVLIPACTSSSHQQAHIPDLPFSAGRHCISGVLSSVPRRDARIKDPAIRKFAHPI